MILTRTARHLFDALLAVAYPQACAICDRSVEKRTFGVTCEACWKATPVFTGAESLCWKCGEPALANVQEELREQLRCRRCDSWAFTAARATGLYEGALRECVLLLKRQPHLPAAVETLLLEAASRAPLNACTMIIPVPLHPKRLLARGFNQATILASALSKRLCLPLDEGSLVRVSATEIYRAGLDAKGRLDTVAGAFAVRYPRLVENEAILLIDDVFTTGATVSACAEVLLEKGAKKVFVLTVARAGKATYF